VYPLNNACGQFGSKEFMQNSQAPQLPFSHYNQNDFSQKDFDADVVSRFDVLDRCSNSHRNSSTFVPANKVRFGSQGPIAYNETSSSQEIPFQACKSV